MHSISTNTEVSFNIRIQKIYLKCDGITYLDKKKIIIKKS